MNKYSDLDKHWLQRWEQGNTGWHHQAFNAHLLNYWHAVSAPVESKVFVPLCGMSLDMVWLVEQGHRVVGVELSRTAVERFFQAQGLTPSRTMMGDLEAWQAGPYQILCGDIFSLQPEHLDTVTAVYDRASLVAFNPQQRKDYAMLLGRLFPTGCRTLLVAMDYPQQEMQGPPYCVNGAEVSELFGARCTIEVLDSQDLMLDSDRYADKGLSRLSEEIYLLTCQ